MQLSLEQEVPLPEAPTDPRYRENFCFEAYDHDRDVGYFIHLGRWSLDPTIWREQVQIYLPDGDFLVRRSWGRAEDLSRGPRGALLGLTCEEPNRRWHVGYRGPARRVTSAELSGGALPERPQILFDLDATFESDQPVWDMGAAMKDQIWGSWHIEQPGLVRGSISVDGKTYPFDGVGYRDHSRGPRHLGAMFDECWVHGLFPSGRAFAVFHMRQKEDGPPRPVLEQAVVWDQGKIYPAVCRQPPLLGESGAPLNAPPTAFLLEIESELGVMSIEAEVRRALPHSTTSHGEWLDGVVTEGDLAHLITFERPTVFHWNGETAGGHTEQARRIR